MIGNFIPSISNPWKFPALAFAALAVSASGQSVADFQHLAETNSPALTAARGRWDAQRHRTGAARSLPDPMAGVDVERSGTQVADYADFEFMLAQDLPGWGKRAARVRTATLEAEVEGFRYLETIRGTRRETARAWWRAWQAEQRIALAREQTNLLASVASAIRSRAQAGQAGATDLLKAEAELARAVSEIAIRGAQREAAVTRLNALVNRPTQTAVDFAASPSVPHVPDDWAALEERARKFCCILIGAQREVDLRSAAVRQARVERRPDFQVRVEARHFEGGGAIDEYDTGFFLNLPWLWRGKYDAELAAARAAQSAAEAEATGRLNDTIAELREQWVMARNAQRTVALYRDELLPQAERLLATVQASYAGGMMALRDVIDAARDVREVREMLVEAQAELGMAWADLESNIEPWTPFERATGLIAEDME